MTSEEGEEEGEALAAAIEEEEEEEEEEELSCVDLALPLFALRVTRKSTVREDAGCLSGGNSV